MYMLKLIQFSGVVLSIVRQQVVVNDLIRCIGCIHHLIYHVENIGFEPMTSAVQKRHSSAELIPRSIALVVLRCYAGSLLRNSTNFAGDNHVHLYICSYIESCWIIVTFAVFSSACY